VLFDLQVHERDGWTVLSVVGELDLAAAPRVRQGVLSALNRSDEVPRVVLDLTEVDLIDSSGLGVVLGTVRRVRAASGEVRVVVGGPPVREVFALTELDRILPLAGSVADAVAIPVPDPDAGAGTEPVEVPGR
jgi:anti-sigma B factor antagonist